MSRPSRAGRAAVEQRARLLELLGRLSPAVLEDLDRRARFVVAPDGFGSATGSDGSRGSEVSRPTERAVVARGEALPPDPVGEQIRVLFGALAEAAGVLAHAGRWLDYLQAYGDRPLVRESSLAGDCKACGRPVAGGAADPIRNGYCNSCRSAYVRWSSEHPVGEDPAAHRAAFELDRRARLAEEPQCRVAVVPTGGECGHRCCSRVYEHEHWHSPALCPACAEVSASGGQVAS